MAKGLFYSEDLRSIKIKFTLSHRSTSHLRKICADRYCHGWWCACRRLYRTTRDAREYKADEVPLPMAPDLLPVCQRNALPQLHHDRAVPVVPNTKGATPGGVVIQRRVTWRENHAMRMLGRCIRPMQEVEELHKTYARGGGNRP
jgi:hypothetical protein